MCVHSGHVKAIISKSVDALGSTLDGIECSIIGDIYNTIFMSMCTKGLLTCSAPHRNRKSRVFYGCEKLLAGAVGFSNYAWSFVSRAFFGMVGAGSKTGMTHPYDAYVRAGTLT